MAGGIEEYTHMNLIASCYIKPSSSVLILSAADVFVTKWHTLCCGRWNIAISEMPTAGGNKWV